MTENYLDLFRLDGRSAVVTGGARGIGHAVCEALTDAGAGIEIWDINGELGKTACEGLVKSGRPARFREIDLTNPAKVERQAELTWSEQGAVDILVNCVGICHNTDVTAIPDDEWREVMNVNVNALYWSCRAFAQRMAARKSGVIVNIGSNSGFIVDKPQPQAHYNASKGAVHMMTKSFACELASQGVRVNAVAPSYTLTEMTRLGLAKSEWSEIWHEMTPMKRFAEPSEIASVVLFLASPAASYMTGSVILVDGGYTCW